MSTQPWVWDMKKAPQPFSLGWSAAELLLSVVSGSPDCLWNLALDKSTHDRPGTKVPDSIIAKADGVEVLHDFCLGYWTVSVNVSTIPPDSGKFNQARRIFLPGTSVARESGCILRGRVRNVPAPRSEARGRLSRRRPPSD